MDVDIYEMIGDASPRGGSIVIVRQGVDPRSIDMLRGNFAQVHRAVPLEEGMSFVGFPTSEAISDIERTGYHLANKWKINIMEK